MTIKQAIIKEALIKSHIVMLAKEKGRYRKRHLGLSEIINLFKKPSISSCIKIFHQLSPQNSKF